MINIIDRKIVILHEFNFNIKGPRNQSSAFSIRNNPVYTASWNAHINIKIHRVFVDVLFEIILMI